MWLNNSPHRCLDDSCLTTPRTQGDDEKNSRLCQTHESKTTKDSKRCCFEKRRPKQEVGFSKQVGQSSGGPTRRRETFHACLQFRTLPKTKPTCKSPGSKDTVGNYSSSCAAWVRTSPQKRKKILGTRKKFSNDWQRTQSSSFRVARRNFENVSPPKNAQKALCEIKRSRPQRTRIIPETGSWLWRKR